MASEHILLTKEQFERLKNKRETIDKNTTATQTHHEEEISLQTTTEQANELEFKDDEKMTALNSKITTSTETPTKMHQSFKENEKNKQVAHIKVERKTIGQKRAPISKKLVNSKILKKDKKNKNSTNKVITWHHL
jgi:hypothetical protein